MLFMLINLKSSCFLAVVVVVVAAAAAAAAAAEYDSTFVYTIPPSGFLFTKKIQKG